MRRNLLITMLCVFVLMITAKAQEITFSYDFDNNSFDGWTGYDADGDGYTWMLDNSTFFGGFNETYGLYSSCYTNGELTPDNYLFTTDTYKITTTSVFYFMHRQSNDVYYQENIGVIISEDGINFLEIWSKKYEEPYPNNKWAEEYIDLSEYAGKKMYIGFRHHDCNGFTANGIRIDNVKLLSEGDDESINEKNIAFEVYPNPVEDRLVISSDKNIEKVSIYTLNGIMISEMKYDNEGIDVSELKSGVYMLMINDGKETSVRKMLKR